MCQEDQQSSSLLVPSLPKAKLFVYDLDLLVDHLPSKPIDRDVNPVVLLAFNDEIVSKTISIWLVVTGLSYYIDQYIPDARLRDRSHRARDNFPSCFDSLIVI